jgi:hypothetical protein
MYGYIYKMRWTAPSNMEQINMLHVDIFYALSNAILYSIDIFFAFKVIKECFKIWNWFIEVQEILECFFGEQ